MITLYHLNNSRSQRILWLLEELDVEYIVKTYKRDPITIRAPKSLKAIHPLGKTPVITDSNGDVTVAESGAITEYLITHYDVARIFQSDNAQEQRSNIYWSHFAEGSFMPPILMALIFRRIKQTPMSFFVKLVARGIVKKVMGEFVQPEIDLMVGFIEQSLEGRDWFADSKPTAADFQMSFPLEALFAAEEVCPQSQPNICAFVKRCQSRPAYLRALEKGGDYKYGPK